MAVEACERAVLALGGMDYAKGYHVERHLREAMLPHLAPVSKEMTFNYIEERVLGLPRSYSISKDKRALRSEDRLIAVNSHSGSYWHSEAKGAGSSEGRAQA